MKITVQSMGLTPHNRRRVFRKKLIKLELFMIKIHDCQVFLKVENTSKEKTKTAEIKLAVQGDDIVVKKTSASFEESLDPCYDTAKKLLIKKKNWLRKIIEKKFCKIFVDFKNLIFAPRKKGIAVLFEIYFASIAQLARARDL